MRKPELLIPASSLEVLKTAVIFGADAVYIGGEAFGLRAKAKNFSMEEMKEGIEFAHARGVKVYVTANILAHNYDLEGVEQYFRELREIHPDALIIADPGVFSIAKQVCPEIERHISTQANNTNYETYRFWYELGAKESFQPGNFLWKRFVRFVHIFRMIVRLRRLFMVQCAFPIPAAVCLAIISREEMPTEVPAHIRADGNMLLWKRPDRENICRFMKMNVAPISSIPKISV